MLWGKKKCGIGDKSSCVRHTIKKKAWKRIVVRVSKKTPLRKKRRFIGRGNNVRAKWVKI